MASDGIGVGARPTRTTTTTSGPQATPAPTATEGSPNVTNDPPAAAPADEPRAKEDQQDTFENVGGPIAEGLRKLTGGRVGLLGGPLGERLGVGDPVAPPPGSVDTLPEDPGIERAPPTQRIGTSPARGQRGYDAAPQDLAREANEKYAKPPSTHPYRQHIEGVHERLRERNLPTSAEGVRVRVTGENLAHGSSVTRSVTGPVGIAPGADIGLSLRRGLDEPTPSFSMTPAETARLEAAQARQEAVQAGTATLDDAAQLGVDFGEEMLQVKRRELAGVVDELPTPSDGKPTLVNMSQNMSPVRMGARVAQEIFSAPPDSPLRREAAEALGEENLDVFDTEELTRLMTERVAARMESPEGSAQLDDAKQHFERDLAAAREQGVLVFTSTSNDYAKAWELTGDPRHSVALTDDVEGLVRVGATHIGADAHATSDDAVTTFTSAGRNVTLAAPGAAVPVGDESFAGPFFGQRRPATLGGLFGGLAPLAGGPPPKPPKPQPVDIDGTSFATPYTVGTAALMVAANPRLTPDAIEQILSDPRVTTDIEGTSRDGAGALDPVLAVELARDWRP